MNRIEALRLLAGLLYAYDHDEELKYFSEYSKHIHDAFILAYADIEFFKNHFEVANTEEVKTLKKELEKYKDAFERLGYFGKLFMRYSGDPRGHMGRMGNATIVGEVLSMQVIEDVDGGRWIPVQEDVLHDLLKILDYLRKT